MQPRQACRHLLGKPSQIVENRGQGEEPEGGKRSGRNQQEQKDGRALGRMPAANGQPRGGAHDGAEHHGKQGADIEQHQHIANQPGHVAGQSQGEGKEDVAAKSAGSIGDLGHARNSCRSE
jgi:hypothetical protein